MSDSLLPGCRVLDLADEKGFLCGRILGDMGADVIKVERPGGDPARNIGPFYKDIPSSEKSLFWFAYNASKRGITLDIESRDGQAIFRELAEGSDFLVESFKPGHLDSIGIGYRDLRTTNPGLVMVSISPFGGSGPYSEYEGPDLTCMAMGGFMATAGDEDKPPVRVSFPQAFLHASAQAAAGAMIAHVYREATGLGQHVDVSAQEAVIWTIQNATGVWDLNRINIKRSGATKLRPNGSRFRMHWPCKDGHVTLGAQASRAVVGEAWASLAKWMESEGAADDYVKEKDWSTLDFFNISQDELDRIMKAGTDFFEGKTRRELYEGAIKRRVLLYPVNSIDELVGYEQLKAREFFQAVEHPELGESLTYPGTFVRLSEGKCEVRRRAPLIGEHNVEVYGGEMGMSRGEMVVLKATGVI